MQVNFRSAMAAGVFGMLLVVCTSLPLNAQSFFPIELSSAASNLCLEPLNDSPAQGTAIVQEPCNGSEGQLWVLSASRYVPGAYYFHYENLLTGMCLDARGSATNKTPVQQWTCNTITNEDWVTGDNNSIQTRVSNSDGFCLDVPDAGTSAGLPMQIYKCNGTNAQNWKETFHPLQPAVRKTPAAAK